MTATTIKDRLQGHHFNYSDYGPVHFQVRTYRDGLTPAVTVHDDGLYDNHIGTLTVNLDERPDENELFIKAWSENADLARAAFATGLFEDTGRRIPTGYVEAQVWRVKD